MSLVIYASVGETSPKKCPLGKYTRIGAAENSSLQLKEDGMPEVVGVVEKTSQDEIRFHCKSSNTTRLKGRLLKRGDVVEWNQGETLDICGGSVRLKLIEEADLRQAESKRSGRSSHRSRHETGGESPSPYPMRTIADESDVESDEEKKKKAKQSVQLTIVVLCAVATVVMFLASNREDILSDNVNAVYYIMDSKNYEPDKPAGYRLLETASKRTPAEVRESFNSETLAALFQSAYLQEEEDPAAALMSYEALLSRLEIAFRDERALKVTPGIYYEELKSKDPEALKAVNDDARISGLKDSWNEAYAFIQGRISKLRTIVSAR